MATTTASPARDDPARTETSPHRRVLALDGLRGLAVIGVLLYHGGHLRGGFLGVDLFFVLSGYLITTVLLRSWGAERRVDLRSFWARRARRLLPALLALLLVVVPVWSTWFATPTELSVLRRDALSALFYVNNWQQIWSGQSYWAATLGASPLRHVWSLSVEEQFYVVWPLAAFAILRARGVRGLRLAAAVGAVAAGCLTIVLALTGTVSLNALYLGTITRSSGLLAGAALAAWTWRGRRRGGPAPAPIGLEYAAVVAAAVLAWMWVSIDVFEPRLYQWGLAVSAICGTILVAAAASPDPGPIVRTLHLAPLRHLGTISYGIYLWSWPIMQMVSERHTDLRGWPLLAAQIAFTLAAAQASWMFLERPILDGALAPPRSQILLAGATVAALIAIVTSTLGAVPLDPTTAGTGGYATAADPSAPKVMVVGDSVPGVIAREGMRPQRNDLGISVVDRAIPGCILLRARGEVRGTEGNLRDDVTPCNQGWRDQVAELQPDIVFAMFGQFASDEVELDGEFLLPCTPAYQQAQREELEAGLDDLTSSGARVVIATAPWSSISWVIDATPGLAERMACLNDQYREVADERDDVEVIDFAGQICPSADRCLTEIDGIDLREDTVHFRGESARLVSRWIVPQLLGQQVGELGTSPEVPRNPYCATIAALFVGSTPGGAGPANLDDAVARLRDAPLDDLVAQAPPEIAPAVTTITGSWDQYLDLFASIPPGATPEEALGSLGLFGPSAIAIADWVGVNC